MFVYAIENLANGHLKFGIAGDVDKRLKSLQTGNSGKLVIRATHRTQFECEARGIERSIHFCLDGARLEGEWFLPVDASKAIVDEMNGAGSLRELLSGMEAARVDSSWSIEDAAAAISEPNVREELERLRREVSHWRERAHKAEVFLDSVVRKARRIQEEWA